MGVLSNLSDALKSINFGSTDSAIKDIDDLSKIATNADALKLVATNADTLKTVASNADALKSIDIVAEMAKNADTLKSASTLADVAKNADVFKTGISSIDNVIDTSSTLSSVVKTISKESDEATSIIKSAGKATDDIVSDVKTVENNISNLATGITKVDDIPADSVKTLKEVAEDADNVSPDGAFKSLWNAHSGKVIVIGATTITVSALLIYSKVATDAHNSTGYTITSIEPSTLDNTVAYIKYTPEYLFSPKDIVIISGSNSSHTVDGTYNGITVVGAGVIQVPITITKKGNIGTMKCITSVGNQLSSTINSITDPIVSSATSTITSTTGSIISSVAKGIFDGLGLGNLTSLFGKYWGIFVIILLLLISSSIILVLKYK